MYNIGIDLGGTGIKIGIVTHDYEIIAKKSVATNLPRPAESITDSMAEVVKQLCEENNISLDEIECVGIGTPGVVNGKTGEAIYSNNLHFRHTPLGPMLQGKLGKQVHVENDANAAAYGEYLNGGGKGHENVVVVTLGTGVGSGIIIDGKIFTGHNFCAAEVGHTVIVKGGAPCTCGRNGCFESYCSATGLIRMTREAMENDKSSKMWEIANSLDEVNGKTSFDGMRMGDATAAKVVDDFVNYLGCGITNIINIFQPEKVLIGGGLSKEGATIIEPLKEYAYREYYNVEEDKKILIDTAKLGNDAGIIGAAFLGGMLKS